MEEADESLRTVWCGNLSNKITEAILYELFLQAAPLEKVCIPKDKDGRQNSYGFVTFKHFVSVQYSIDLLDGTLLYDKRICIKPRNVNSVRQQFVNQNNFPDINLLMEMGNRLLIDKVNGEFDNYEGDRTPKLNRYKDDYYYRNRNNNKRNINNFKPYQRNKRYDRY